MRHLVPPELVDFVLECIEEAGSFFFAGLADHGGAGKQGVECFEGFFGESLIAGGQITEDIISDHGQALVAEGEKDGIVAEDQFVDIDAKGIFVGHAGSSGHEFTAACGLCPEVFEHLDKGVGNFQQVFFGAEHAGVSVPGDLVDRTLDAFPVPELDGIHSAVFREDLLADGKAIGEGVLVEGEGLIGEGWVVVDRFAPKKSFERCHSGEKKKVPEGGVFAEVLDFSFFERVEVFELGEHSLHVFGKGLLSFGQAGGFKEDGVVFEAEELVEGKVVMVADGSELGEGDGFFASDAAIDAVGAEVEQLA